MVVTLSKEELGRIYSFTKDLKCPQATRVFNLIFTEDHIDMIQLADKSDKTSVDIKVDSEITVVFMNAFIKNAGSISSLSKAGKVTLLCTAEAVFKQLKKDIDEAVETASRIWRRKKNKSARTVTPQQCKHTSDCERYEQV